MRNILIIGCGLLGSSLIRRVSKKKIAKKIFIYEKSKSNIRFINSYSLIKWNLDKTYLLDLEKKGINIPKTILVKRKEKISLKDLFSKTNWKEAIIKPTVSGAARHTYRINHNNYLNYDYSYIHQKNT